MSKQLSPQQQDSFHRDGFLILRDFTTEAVLSQLRSGVDAAMRPLIGPAEFEADVSYPGAPEDRDAEGGHTPRRLLHALARGPQFRSWATQEALGTILRQLFGGKAPRLSQCHHNCIMTKAPRFSSETHWHQDIRYWSFARPELISFWLALGEESPENGSLCVLPGSHRIDFTPQQLDERKFLRTDAPENQPLLRQVVELQLAPGDLLLFHCRTFHAAGANITKQTKLSLVFTAHAEDNHPQPGTRSANYPSLPFAGS